jgi:frataxin
LCLRHPSLSELEFHKLADQTLENILERLEAWLEEVGLDDADVELSQGVLTLKLGDAGTYVINKQTPNRQLWMSSPVSGPVRYDWVHGAWVYHRDGHAMHNRFGGELEQLGGISIDLNPCSSCAKMNACVEGNYCLKD